MYSVRKKIGPISIVYSGRMIIRPKSVVYSVRMKVRPKCIVYSISMNIMPKSIVYSITMKIRAKSTAYSIRMKSRPKCILYSFRIIIKPTSIVYSIGMKIRPKIHSIEYYARFKRRTLHEPNLIIWFGACKDRRMKQLGSTDLYLGRPAVLFDCPSRIERQKFDFDSDVELLHLPNQMHTLRINYIYPRGLRVPSTWHMQRSSF